MTPEARKKLREAAHVAFNVPLAARWELQTSNSYRRIGTFRGDGDVLVATVHRDGQPDLLASPGALDYIIAAQPSVVMELLDYIEDLERRISS